MYSISGVEPESPEENELLVWDDVDNRLVSPVALMYGLTPRLKAKGISAELRVIDDCIYALKTEGSAPPFLDSVFSFAQPTHYSSDIICERHEDDSVRVQSIDTTFTGDIGGISFIKHERTVLRGDDKGFINEFLATFKDIQGKEIEISVVQELTPFGNSSILEIKREGMLCERIDLLDSAFQDNVVKLPIVLPDGQEDYEGFGHKSSFSMNAMRTASGNLISFNYELGALQIMLHDGTAISLSVPPLQLNATSIPDSDIFIDKLGNDGFYKMFQGGLSSPKVWLNPADARTIVYKRPATWGSAASDRRN
jgi:hypothetical protein